jgi:hypothetical protein
MGTPRAQIHVERALGDVELQRNLAHTELPLAIQGLRGQRRGFRLPGEPARAATTAATGPCGHEPRVGALPNEVTLELRQRPKHVKHQFPTARGRIQVLLETLEADAPLR